MSNTQQFAAPNTFILDSGPQNAAHRLIIAHGAGAGITFLFLETMTSLMVERGFAVTRFEFAYMAARRTGGPRRPPPKIEQLTKEYVTMLQSVSATKPPRQTLLIGGKSMGGRVASLMAQDAFDAGSIVGLFCLGYPFHPPGKPDQLRTAHLETLTCPTLIVQGERDPFGNRTEVERYQLSPAITYQWAPDGDHDLGPRGNSGHVRKGNLAAAADAIAQFAQALPTPR